MVVVVVHRCVSFAEDVIGGGGGSSMRFICGGWWWLLFIDAFHFNR